MGAASAAPAPRKWPTFIERSARLAPAVRTRTSTSLSPGTGLATSRTSSRLPPASCTTTAARIWVPLPLVEDGAAPPAQYTPTLPSVHDHWWRAQHQHLFLEFVVPHVHLALPVGNQC